MANIKSAIKRIDIAKRNALQNKKYLSRIKTFTKKYLLALDKYTNETNLISKELVTKILGILYSKIDKATKRNILHKNTASRKKSKLRIALNTNNLVYKS